MAQTITVVQGHLFNRSVKRTTFRFAQHEYRNIRDTVEQAKCEDCGKVRIKRHMVCSTYYAPFSDEPYDTEWYCKDCAENGDRIRENITNCDACNRDIYNDPYSSAMVIDDGEAICARCYQEDKIANGYTRRECASKDPIILDHAREAELIDAGYCVAEQVSNLADDYRMLIRGLALRWHNDGSAVVITTERSQRTGYYQRYTIWERSE